MPKKWIYEPHKCPLQDQKKAGVSIRGDGVDTEVDGVAVYPKPMFDFNTQRDICLQGMKKAYQVNLHGNSPQVFDGSWEGLFEDSGAGLTKGEKGGPGGTLGLDKAKSGDAHEVPVTPEKTLQAPKQPKPASKRAHKREHSQGTLDGAFNNKRSKH